MLALFGRCRVPPRNSPHAYRFCGEERTPNADPSLFMGPFVYVPSEAIVREVPISEHWHIITHLELVSPAR